MSLSWQIVRKLEVLLLVPEDVSAYAFPVPDVRPALAVVDVAAVLADARLAVQNVQEVALFFAMLNAYKIAAQDAITIVGKVVTIHALVIVILCVHRIVMIAIQNNKDIIFCILSRTCLIKRGS